MRGGTGCVGHRGRVLLSALLLGLLGAAPGLLRAQTPASPAPDTAAATITAAALARHVEQLTQDSPADSGVPGRARDRRAAYVAAQLQRLGGLRPAHGDTTPNGFVQRYRIPGTQRLSYTASQLLLYAFVHKGQMPVFTEAGTPALTFRQLDWARDARVGGTHFPAKPLGVGRPVAVLTGRHTLASVRAAKLAGDVVFYLPPLGTDSVLQQAIADSLTVANYGVVVVGPEDSTTFARRLRDARQQPVRLTEYAPGESMQGPSDVPGWVLYLRAGAVAQTLITVGLDVAQVRTDTLPAVRVLAPRATWGSEALALSLVAVPQPDTTDNDMTTADNMAPNVIAVLLGSDSVLRSESVVISASLNERGGAAPGAAEQAVTTAGLLELAAAFTRAGVRPRRTLVFGMISGVPHPPWGGRAFVKQLAKESSFIGTVVADLHLGSLGGRHGDTMAVEGLRDLELPVRPDWVATQHPELYLNVVDGGHLGAHLRDHLALVEARVPSLYLSTENSGDDAAADTAPAVNLDLATRLLRLVFYVGTELANADARPGWTPEGRRARLEYLGH